MVESIHVASLLRYIRERAPGKPSFEALSIRLRAHAPGLNSKRLQRLAAGGDIFNGSHLLDASKEERLREEKRVLLNYLANRWEEIHMPAAFQWPQTAEQTRKIAVYAHLIEHASSRVPAGCSCKPAFSQFDSAISVGWMAFELQAVQQICLDAADAAFVSSIFDRFIDYVTMSLRAKRPGLDHNGFALERWESRLRGLIRPEFVAEPCVATSLANFCREVSNWYIGSANAPGLFERWHGAGLALARLGVERHSELARARLHHNSGMQLYRCQDPQAKQVFKECHEFFSSADSRGSFRLSDETAENLLLICIKRGEKEEAHEFYRALAERPSVPPNFWTEAGLQVTQALYFDKCFRGRENRRVRGHLESAYDLHKRFRIRQKPVLHLPYENALDRFISEPHPDRFEVLKVYRQALLDIGQHLEIGRTFATIYPLVEQCLAAIHSPASAWGKGREPIFPSTSSWQQRRGRRKSDL